MKNLHFTKTSTPFPPKSPTSTVSETYTLRTETTANEEAITSYIVDDQITADSLPKSHSLVQENKNLTNSESMIMNEDEQWPTLSSSIDRSSPVNITSSVNKLTSPTQAAEIKEIHQEIAERISRSSQIKLTSNESQCSVIDNKKFSKELNLRTESSQSNNSEKKLLDGNGAGGVLVKGDNSTCSSEANQGYHFFVITLIHIFNF